MLNTLLIIFNRAITLAVFILFCTGIYGGSDPGTTRESFQTWQFVLNGILMIYFEHKNEQVDRNNFIKHMNDMVWRNTSKNIVNQSLIVSQLTKSNQLELFSCNKMAKDLFKIKSSSTFNEFLSGVKLELGECVFNSRLFEHISFKKSLANLRQYLLARHSKMQRDSTLTSMSQEKSFTSKVKDLWFNLLHKKPQNVHRFSIPPFKNSQGDMILQNLERKDSESDVRLGNFLNFLDQYPSKVNQEGIGVDYLHCNIQLGNILRKFRVSVFKYKEGPSGPKSPLLILCLEEITKDDFKNLKEQILESRNFILNILKFFAYQFKTQIGSLTPFILNHQENPSKKMNENNISSSIDLIDESESRRENFNNQLTPKKSSKQINQQNIPKAKSVPFDQQQYTQYVKLLETSQNIQMTALQSVIQASNFSDCYRIKEQKPIPLSLSIFSLSELLLKIFSFFSKKDPPELMYNSKQQLIYTDQRRLVQVIFNILTILRNKNERKVVIIVNDDHSGKQDDLNGSCNKATNIFIHSFHSYNLPSEATPIAVQDPSHLRKQKKKMKEKETEQIQLITCIDDENSEASKKSIKSETEEESEAADFTCYPQKIFNQTVNHNADTPEISLQHGSASITIGELKQGGFQKFKNMKTLQQQQQQQQRRNSQEEKKEKGKDTLMTHQKFELSNSDADNNNNKFKQAQDSQSRVKIKNSAIMMKNKSNPSTKRDINLEQKSENYFQAQDENVDLVQLKILNAHQNPFPIYHHNIEKYSQYAIPSRQKSLDFQLKESIQIQDIPIFFSVRDNGAPKFQSYQFNRQISEGQQRQDNISHNYTSPQNQVNKGASERIQAQVTHTNGQHEITHCPQKDINSDKNGGRPRKKINKQKKKIQVCDIQKTLLMIEVKFEGEQVNFHSSEGGSEQIQMLATNEILKLIGPNKKIRVTPDSISFDIFTNLEDEQEIEPCLYSNIEDFEQLINLSSLMDDQTVEIIARVDRAITHDIKSSIFLSEEVPHISPSKQTSLINRPKKYSIPLRKLKEKLYCSSSLPYDTYNRRNKSREDLPHQMNSSQSPERINIKQENIAPPTTQRLFQNKIQSKLSETSIFKDEIFSQFQYQQHQIPTFKIQVND